LWSRRIIAVKRSRDVGRVALSDEAVRVRRVADDEDLHVLGRAGVQRLSLGLEDPAVGFEQVRALHPLRARLGADEQGDVDAVERLLGVVGHLDAGEQGEGAVVELHGHALDGLHGIRDLEQGEDDGLVGAEHVAGGDAKEQRVADLAGGAGDGDADGAGCVHWFISSMTASANCEVPTAEGSSRLGFRS